MLVGSRGSCVVCDTTDSVFDSVVSWLVFTVRLCDESPRGEGARRGFVS